MTCIDLSLEDLLSCSFGLSKREVVLLLRLLQAGGWMPISALASRPRKDRSVVQRGLSSLMAKNLAERDQRNRPRGGYEYLYRAKGKREIKAAMIAKSRAFSAMVSGAVRRW
jgi:predicted transcriptional regulator